MSSEESDGAVGTKRSFHIKILPWRAPELTVWLHNVDNLSLVNEDGVTLSSRAVFRARFLSHKVSTFRKPLKGLPASFYNSDWLVKRDPVEVSNLRMKRVGDIPQL